MTVPDHFEGIYSFLGERNPERMSDEVVLSFMRDLFARGFSPAKV